ncbi:hypothetical protein [Thiocystis violacea]|uniref:hypothetical protein n=1 Tax=Thiocystis violacea TaxID=13725 RepID=UPI001903E812|nr:hypothetical protein [Thiocystis violacea]MBK1719242.1 hypothetical protein [Thiocystis violacea]
MNVWSRFKSLTPAAPLLVGTVEAVLSDGARRVILPGGGVVIASGEALAGARVFVRVGVIEGEAPVLATVEIEV